MPGILKAPGQFNFFIEVGIDLLGYDFLRHVGPRPDLHGVFLAGGHAGLGLTGYPGRLRLTLEGELGADISAITSLPVDGFVYQSDIAGGGALIIGTRDGRFVQRTRLIRYINVESDIGAPVGDTQLRTTFGVTF
jgi:hypothetical protein